MTSPHVLIVEDEGHLSLMYAKMLRHFNFHPHDVSTIDCAIQALFRFDPDIICLDWHIRQRTGAEVLNFMRTLEPESHPQVLVFSGNLDNARLTGHEDLISQAVERPISLNAFIDIIKELAEKARNRHPIQRIQVDRLQTGIVRLTWQGHITGQFIRANMTPGLYEAERVIFDARNLSFERLKMADFSPAVHPPLPNLKELHVVYHPPTENQVKKLMNYFSPRPEIHYHASLEAACTALGLILPVGR